MSVYICIGNVLFMKQSFLKYVFKIYCDKVICFSQKKPIPSPTSFITFTMFERKVFHSVTAKTCPLRV